MSLYILLRLRNIHQRPDNKDDVFGEDFENHRTTLLMTIF
jgi:hypothetical protein